MREIKFRAWNRKENRWATESEFGKMAINPFQDQYGGGKFGATLGFIDPNIGVEITGHDLELMQFTGLHDKNGKEIYEGDIVRNYRNEARAVKWEAREEDEGTSYIAGFWFSDETDDMEVIGNIYENPELLNTP